MDSEQKRQKRNDLLIIKQVIEPELVRLEQLILFHKPEESDLDFSDYVNKAAYYRDILIRINQDLDQLNE